MSNGSIKPGGALLPLFNLPDGAKLDGKWEIAANSNFGGVHAASSTVITLHPDGTFECTNWAGVETADKNGGRGVKSGLAKGTYEFAGGQLKLSDNGRTVTLPVYGVGKKTEPNPLTIDGHDFTKR